MGSPLFCSPYSSTNLHTNHRRQPNVAENIQLRKHPHHIQLRDRHCSRRGEHYIQASAGASPTRFEHCTCCLTTRDASFVSFVPNGRLPMRLHGSVLAWSLGEPLPPSHVDGPNRHPRSGVAVSSLVLQFTRSVTLPNMLRSWIAPIASPGRVTARMEPCIGQTKTAKDRDSLELMELIGCRYSLTSGYRRHPFNYMAEELWAFPRESFVKSASQYKASERYRTKKRREAFSIITTRAAIPGCAAGRWCRSCPPP